MQRIASHDPTWQKTFPRLVTPSHEEWLPSLLLRCDERNHWGSGTSFRFLLHTAVRPAWTPAFNFSTPPLRVLERLGDLLMLPVSVLARTTHLSEMARFADGDLGVFEERAHALYGFYLCPECLTQEGVLRRTLVLPHIKSCHQHQLTLHSRCHCRTSLQLFHRQAWPFTCAQCGTGWGKLPRIEAPAERLQLEEKLQAYYAFFFSEGTPELLISTLALIRERAKEKGKRALPSDAFSEGLILGPRYQGNDHQEYQDFVKQKRVSLGKLAYALIDLELSIGDIVTYAEHCQRGRALSNQ